MKEVLFFIVISAVAFFAGYIFHDQIKSPVAPIPQNITNALQIITNIRYSVNTVFLPQENDTARYTNLYTDTTNLFAQIDVLTNEIQSLNNNINSIHPFIGVGFVRGDIPVAIGGGVQWKEWIGEASLSFTGVASVMAYRRF